MQTRSHTHHQLLLVARLWEIINFPLMKSRFHALGGPFPIRAAQSTAVQRVLFEPTGYIPASVFLHERSYINERGVLSFFKGLRLIWGIHLFAFGGWWLPATATILLSFSLDLALTLLTHFGLCVLSFCVLRQRSWSQKSQIKVKKLSHWKSFHPPAFSFPFSTSYSYSTHSHTQLPRRRGPLPGDACWWKRTRPLPEGQREPGGQAPREDVTGIDREGRGGKKKKLTRKDHFMFLLLMFCKLKAEQQSLQSPSLQREEDFFVAGREQRYSHEYKMEVEKVCQVKRIGAFLNPSWASRPSQFSFNCVL